MSRVWLASEADLPAVAGLMMEFRDWWGHSGPPDEAYPRAVRRLMTGGDADVVLAGAPDAVAVVRYRYVVWTDSLECELEDLFVSAAARGGGLGRILVAAAMDRAGRAAAGACTSRPTRPTRPPSSCTDRSGSRRGSILPAATT